MKAQLIISAAAIVVNVNRIPHTNAFQTSHFSPIISQQNKQHISVALSAGKGFGDKPTPTKQKSKPTQTITSQDTSTTTTATAPSAYGQPATKDASGTIQEETGSQLLKELRRQEAEKRDEELRKLRDLRNTDALLAEEGTAASAIPERVAQRMGKRMLPFVGIPLFGSFASFIGFWYLATQKDLEFQPAVVATTSFVFLAIGLLGITYSVMSASWDDEREGEGGLGVEEFKKNVGSLKEGLSRTKENAILREKMAGLSEKEIQRAIDDAERRNAFKNKDD